MNEIKLENFKTFVINNENLLIMQFMNSLFNNSKIDYDELKLENINKFELFKEITNFINYIISVSENEKDIKNYGKSRKEH